MSKEHDIIVELDQYLSAEMRAASEDLDKIMEIQKELTVDSCKQLCMVYGAKWDALNRMRNVIWRVYDKYREDVKEEVNAEDPNKFEHR